jgi:integrase
VETAVRFGELSALTPADVDVKRSRVVINKAYADVRGKLILSRPKSRSGVRVVGIIDERVMSELEQHVYRQRKEGSPLLFHTMRGAPKPLRRGNFRQRWIEPARLVSGFPDQYTWHSLRHKGITRWINLGLERATVTKMAGHASEEFTRRTYYGVDEEHVAGAIETGRRRMAGRALNPDFEFDDMGPEG